MKHGGNDDMTVPTSATRNTDDERTQAALTVVESCPDDARTILAMLGLDAR